MILYYNLFWSSIEPPMVLTHYRMIEASHVKFQVLSYEFFTSFNFYPDLKNARHAVSAYQKP